MLHFDGRRPGRLGSRANLSRKRSLQRGPVREWEEKRGNGIAL